MSDFEIVRREDFSDVTYLLEVRHPMMARAARPGQFVIVMLHEHGERIPLTIADYDRERGTITLVIQAVGKTTREMQQACRVGAGCTGWSADGRADRARPRRKVVCVGGGLGVAPIFPQALGHKEAAPMSSRCSASAPRSSCSGRTSSGACCDELILCTNDGSAGMQGLITDGIEAGARAPRRHRRGGRDRPPGDDEGVRRGDAPARDQDHGERQPDHGRRHRHVRRLPHQGRRRRSSSLASTAPTSTATWSTSTT